MDIATTLTSFEIVMAVLGYLFMVSSVALFYLILSSTTPIAKHHKTSIIIISICLYLVTINLGILTVNKLLKVPKILSSQPKMFEELDMNNPTITITFETPINTQTLRVHTFPEVNLILTPQGYFNNHIPYTRTVIIKPEVTYPSGEEVMIYLSNIEGPLTHGYGGEYLLKLITPDLPTIDRITFPYDISDVPVSASLSATISRPLVPSGKFSVMTTPESDMELSISNGSVISVFPKKPLKQGTEYTLTIYQTPLLYRYTDKQIIQEYSPRLERSLVFKTISPPLISLFEPSGSGVRPDSDIKITFDQQMNPAEVEQKLSLSPPIPLSFSWESDKTVVIRHDPFKKDATYHVVIPQGVTTNKGAVFESDAVFEFKTLGPITLTQSTPAHNATNISTQSPISITFDQEIDTESSASFFSIAPPVSGKVTIEKSTVTFLPDKPLLNDTRYTISIAPGLKSVFGLPSVNVQTFSFTTVPVQLILPVPYFRQQSDFTCNIASARMLLAYRGITTDEETLITVAGISQNRGTGNPNIGYVPDYGTYWDPVSRSVNAYRPYHLIKNGTLSDITRELVSGNPVMIWGQNGWSDPHDISWTANDGTFIRAINGMHSAVIRGFSGPETNPTQIFLNDPWRGQYAIPTSEFLRRWGYFNVALVVE